MVLREFANSRAVVHLADGSGVITAWVSPESGEVLVLDVSQHPPMTFGQKVLVRLSNLKFSTVFPAEFIGFEGDLALFTLPTSFARHPGDPKARFRRPAPPLRLLVGMEWVPVQSVDISYGGLSILTPQHYNVGAALMMEADFGDVQSRFHLLVRYSVTDTKVAGSARIGGEIQNFPRVDLHRWRNWIESQSTVSSQNTQRAA